MIEINTNLSSFTRTLYEFKGHDIKSLEGNVTSWDGEFTGHFSQGMSILYTPDGKIHSYNLRVLKEPEQLPIELVMKAPDHKILIQYTGHTDTNGREIIGELQTGDLSKVSTYLLKVEDICEDDVGVRVFGEAIPYEIKRKELRRINLNTPSGSRRWNATIDDFLNNVPFLIYTGEPVSVGIMFKAI